MIHKSEIADGWGKDALERGKSQVNERSRRDYGNEYDVRAIDALLIPSFV